MSKHTAGPWNVTEDGEICAGPVEGSGICIGSLYAAEDYPCLDPEDEAKCDEEYKANAKLIAAAPELLEALIQCRSELHRNLQRETDDTQRAWLKAAHGASDAVIAKAQGH